MHASATTHACHRPKRRIVFSKYSSAKGISSDTYFGAEDNEELRAAGARLASLSGARAISSDQVFSAGGGGGGGYDGGGGGARYGAGAGGRAAGSVGTDVGEFASKLGEAIGEDAKKLASEMAARAAKLRDGLAAFADVMRR